MSVSRLVRSKEDLMQKRNEKEESAAPLPVTEVEGAKVSWDPAQLRKIQEHPCFSKDACHFFGRMHLPVAPKCNI